MIMSAFKVGDEVEFLENYGGYTIGERARVIYVDTDGTMKVYHLNFLNKPRWVLPKRVKLVPKDPVLTPEEVFEHLRKGTKLQFGRDAPSIDFNYEQLPTLQYSSIIDLVWRIKPEPEVIELNGKRYKLLED